MTQPDFSALEQPEIREAADRIASYLALTSIDNAPNRIDLVCLAGNGVLASVDHAAGLARQHDCLLLITGGVGHSTPPLVAALASRLDCAPSALADLSEAELISRLIEADSLIARDQIILETRSTNTGENAAFTRDTLKELGLKPYHVVLVQDPLLQRRTDATFHHVWRERSTHFFSSPPLRALSRRGAHIWIMDARAVYVSAPWGNQAPARYTGWLWPQGKRVHRAH